MNSENQPVRSLREIEMEVLEEGREWTRRRLEQKLQEEATRHGGVFPLSGRKAHHRKRQTMHLRTALLRPVLRCIWGPTQTVFERVAARPSHGLDLLAKRSFP